MQENFPQARIAYERSLEISQSVGDVSRESMSLQNLGVVAHKEGDARRAAVLLRQAFACAMRSDDLDGIIGAAAALGGALADLGQPERGAKILSAAEQLMDDHGTSPQASDTSLVSEFHAAIEQRTDEETLRAHDRRGPGNDV